MFNMNTKLYKHEIYHLCNKSIANFGIFKEDIDAQRFIETLDYYCNQQVWTSFSQTLKYGKYVYENLLIPRNYRRLKYLSYCIMPDHYHLLVKITTDYPVPKYINDVENSFTRYFNLKHNRKGPLWQSSFRRVRIISNEQLLHVSRYIHLNPVTAKLVEDPDEWKFSSFKFICMNGSLLENDLTEISIRSARSYRVFVDNNKDYQRRLKDIKRQILE